MKFANRMTLSIVVFLAVLIAGAFVYHQAEDWRYFDSLYFTVVTVTTVGYGDLAPQTDLGKLFTIFYSFFGIAIAFYFFSMIGRYMFRRHLYERLKESGRLKHNKGYRRIKP